MNKIILLIVIIFILILGTLIFFKDNIFTTLQNTEQKTTKNLEVRINVPKKIGRDFDDRIAKVEKILREDKTLTEEMRADFEIDKSLNKLSKRDESSIKESIINLKYVHSSVEAPIKKRAKALRKLAGMYWRTGGSEVVFREVYSGEYKKYADDADGNVAMTSIAMFKDSYNLDPTAKTAIEIAQYYSSVSDFDNTKKWISIAENFPKEIESAPFLYKKMIVNSRLAKGIPEEFERYKKLYTKNYNDVIDVYSQYTEYGTWQKQTIPFVYMFYAVALNNENNKDNKAEIISVLDTMLKIVESDPRPELNEFLYFLNIQKNKTDRDLLGEELDNLANTSLNFKTFLEKYGFVITHKKI